MNRLQCSTAVCVLVVGIGASACGSASPGTSAANEPVEVTEARQSVEVAEQQTILERAGWAPQGWEPAAAQRNGSASWTAVMKLSKRDGAESARLVYVHDAPTGAVTVHLEPRDDASARALRADLLALNEAAPESAIGCDVGCDALPITCVSWFCAYVATMGSDAACTTLLNPLGLFTTIAVRTGRTNPLTCQAFYTDWIGLPFSCPKPNTETTLKVCWPV